MKTTNAMRHAVRDFHARLDAQRKLTRQDAKAHRQTRFDKIAEKQLKKLERLANDGPVAVKWPVAIPGKPVDFEAFSLGFRRRCAARVAFDKLERQLTEQGAKSP